MYKIIGEQIVKNSSTGNKFKQFILEHIENKTTHYVSENCLHYYSIREEN